MPKFRKYLNNIQLLCTYELVNSHYICCRGYYNYRRLLLAIFTSDNSTFRVSVSIGDKKARTVYLRVPPPIFKGHTSKNRLDHKKKKQKKIVKIVKTLSNMLLYFKNVLTRFGSLGHL